MLRIMVTAAGPAPARRPSISKDLIEVAWAVLLWDLLIPGGLFVAMSIAIVTLVLVLNS
jgi:hypothetical protein